MKRLIALLLLLAACGDDSEPALDADIGDSGVDAAGDTGEDALMTDAALDGISDATGDAPSSVDTSVDAGPPECIDIAAFDRDALAAAVGPRPMAEPTISGTIRFASTREEFVAALSASAAGDGIEVSGGPHDWGVLTITQTGVTIASGQFTGSTAFDIRGTGNTFHSLHFSTMTFNAAPEVDSFRSSAVMYFKDGADGNRVLGCSWDGIGAGGNQFAIITTAASDLEIADCDVRNVPKASFGFAVNAGTTGGGTGYHIHHNRFSGEAEYREGFGGTPIRIGLLANESAAVVEYNHISAWTNDNETIENKGSGGIFRFNLLEDNGPDSFLSNRVGHRNVFYANYVGDASLGVYDNGDENIYVYNFFRRHPAPAFGDIAVSLFLQTPGEPGHPPEPGAASGSIRANVFQGFTRWLATVQQFGPYLAPPMGMELVDNVFIGTNGVDGAAGYIPDNGAVDVSFDQWLAANTTRNFSPQNMGMDVYCADGPLERGVVAIGGVEFTPPFWWPGF